MGGPERRSAEPPDEKKKKENYVKMGRERYELVRVTDSYPRESDFHRP
jgi:hypothetical protein